MLNSCRLDTENIYHERSPSNVNPVLVIGLSRLDYASQHWSPYLLKHIYLIEKGPKSFYYFYTHTETKGRHRGGINVSSDCSFDFHISNLAKNNKTFNWLDAQNFLL